MWLVFPGTLTTEVHRSWAALLCETSLLFEGKSLLVGFGFFLVSPCPPCKDLASSVQQKYISISTCYEKQIFTYTS